MLLHRWDNLAPWFSDRQCGMFHAWPKQSYRKLLALQMLVFQILSSDLPFPMFRTHC